MATFAKSSLDGPKRGQKNLSALGMQGEKEHRSVDSTESGHAAFRNRCAAEAVVDAALICREEAGEERISWQSRQELIEAICHNPLLTAQLFTLPRMSS